MEPERKKSFGKFTSLVVINCGNDASYKIQINVDSNGIPTGIFAFKVFGGNNFTVRAYTNLNLDEYDGKGCIGLSDIEAGTGAGLGSVLMYLMCLIGRARGCKYFEVRLAGPEHPVWGRLIDLNVLKIHPFDSAATSWIADLDEAMELFRKRAIAKGWDVSALENMSNYIVVVSEPDPGKRHSNRSNRCTLM